MTAEVIYKGLLNLLLRLLKFNLQYQSSWRVTNRSNMLLSEIDKKSQDIHDFLWMFLSIEILNWNSSKNPIGLICFIYGKYD